MVSNLFAQAMNVRSELKGSMERSGEGMGEKDFSRKNVMNVNDPFYCLD
jgi:hypothetical protein